MTGRRVVVGRVSDIPPGERRIVEAGGRSIGVFNVRGAFYAIRNTCPHQGAPLCLGVLTGTTLPAAPGEYRWGRDGEIIRCPWHGWEFDVTTGRSIFNPHRERVKSYEVFIEECAQNPSGQDPPGGDRSDEDPSVETFPVAVEGPFVVLYL